MLESIFAARGSFVVEGYFEEDKLDGNHERCLHEQGLVVVCSKPVEHSARVSAFTRRLT